MKKKIDPKSLDVPNICFSLTKENDTREPKMKSQRLERGFDDSETWSLADTICNFIIPRLDRYEELANNFLDRPPELVNKINTFNNALKLLAKNEGAWGFTKEEQELVSEGLSYFPEIFLTLWW